MKLIKKIENKETKDHLLLPFLAETGSGGKREPVRERKCHFSLDFSAFGPSVLVGLRSKVDLHYKGCVGTPIFWSSENSKR